MKKTKQVFVFMDTNILWNQDKNFNIFNTFLLNQIITLRDFFIEEVKTAEIQIIFPQTAISERYKQKFDLIKTDIEITKSSLIKLKQMDLFYNAFAIEELEEIQKSLFKRIQHNGEQFLKKNHIFATPECPNEYFEKIIHKAYEKEKPFDNKKVDGFKDALIWYSIIHYLKNQHVKKDDLIFLFTKNKKDFFSEKALREFQDLVKNDIHIIDFQQPLQVYHSENCEFLSYILKEAQNTKITKITIKYSELGPGSLIIENVVADPFPSNLVSLLEIKNLQKNGWKQTLKEQTLNLLKNFDFNIDETDIKFDYVKLPSICEVMVFLDFHEEGYYYDIGNIEVMFEDGEVTEADYESMVIPSDCIISSVDPDYEYFKIDSKYNESIAKMVSKQINRKIDPNLLNYADFT